MNSTPALLARARALTGFAELVGELDPGTATTAQALLDSAGLRVDPQSEPEATVDLYAVVRMLEDAAARFKTPDFGLRLAAKQDISALGPIALIAQQAPTVRGALQAMARNLPYHVARTSIWLEEEMSPGWSQLRYQLPLPAEMPQRQTVELCCLLAVRSLRLLAGDAVDGLQVALRSPATRAQRYARLFEAPVRLAQDADLIAFPSPVLERPVAGADAALGRLAERFVAQVVRRHPLDLGRQIEELIARQIGSGPFSLPVIARQLAMHERTLQRRLDDQRLQFADIAERVRRQRAQDYLKQLAIPLPEVAQLLGYGDVRSLTRASRRWFGASPGVVRRQLAA